MEAPAKHMKKSLAEAEGIDKKAEAMKKYGQAAVVDMVMKCLPEIAKDVAEPLSKVDHITMFGEGNSAKLLGDIVSGTTQVTEGISTGLGLDLKAILAGALGGKLATQAPASTEPILPSPVPVFELNTDDTPIDNPVTENDVSTE